MDIYQLDSGRQKKAVRYEEIHRRLTFIEWAIIGVVLLIFVFGGVSRLFSTFLNFSQPWASVAYFVILGIIIGILTLPISYYGGYVLPHKYGLATDKFRTWIADQAKGAVLVFTLGLIFVIFVYWVLDSLPNYWWILTSIFLLLVSLLLTRLTPTLLVSLFFKLEPLQNRDLENRLKNLAQKAKSSIQGVYTINLSAKGTTANAMLGGFGKTRRILLTDTLLQTYSPEEIEVILAHELGHHVLGHIPNLILVQVVTALLSFYLVHLSMIFGMGPFGFKSLSDVTAFPFMLLILSVIGLIMTPVLNAYSRQLETNADLNAIELTNNPEAFISAMTKLTDQNLSVAEPRRWVEIMFYDHPPYSKRVQLAYKYIQSHKEE